MLRNCPVSRNTLVSCVLFPGLPVAVPWPPYSFRSSTIPGNPPPGIFTSLLPIIPSSPSFSSCVKCGVYCRADVSAWQCPLGGWPLRFLFVFNFFKIIWYNLISSGLLPTLKFICMSLKRDRKHFSCDSVVQTDTSQEAW